jgi:hypothetical protein
MAQDYSSKLIEEVKLYWTVQTAIAGVLGYLGTNIKAFDLQAFIVCVVAFLLITIGAIYNFVGNYYVFVEAEGRVGFCDREENLVTPAIAAMYFLVSGVIGAVCIVSLWPMITGSAMGGGVTRGKLALAAIGMLVGAFVNWQITRKVFENLYQIGTDGYRKYSGWICPFYNIDRNKLAAPRPTIEVTHD